MNGSSAQSLILRPRLKVFVSLTSANPSTNLCGGTKTLIPNDWPLTVAEYIRLR